MDLITANEEYILRQELVMNSDLQQGLSLSQKINFS